MIPKELNEIIENLNGAARSAYSQREFFNAILDIINIEIVVPKNTPSNKRNDYYYQTIIDYIEEHVTEEQRQIFYQEIEFPLVQFIHDENVKKNKLSESYQKWYSKNTNEISSIHIDTIITLHDDRYKLKFYEENADRLDYMDIGRLIASLDSDDLIEQFVELYEYDDEEPLAEIIKGFSSDEIKLKYFEYFKEDLGKTKSKIISTFHSDEIKMQYLDKMDKIPFVIISSLKDPNNILKYWDKLPLNDKGHLLDYIHDEQIIKNILTELINSDYNYGLANHIARLSNDNDKVHFLKLHRKCNKQINDYSVISSIKDPNKMLEVLKSYGSPRTFKLIRKNKKLDSKIILDNIDLFIANEIEGITSEEIVKYKVYLNRMYIPNNDIVYTIDFNLLEDKYLASLGEDRINFIGTFENIQRQVLDLNDKNYQVFARVLNYYSKKNNKLDWTYVANQLLGAFHWKECEVLIDSVDDVRILNIEYLTRLLLDGNFLNIQTVDELNRYPEILKDRCDRQIESDNIYEQINAIMVKLCGIGQDQNMLRGFTELRRHDTWNLTKFFGEDIELIEDSPYKEFIKRLKRIQAIKDPNKLRQMYNSIKEFRHVDIYKLETELKKAYLKLYNERLLKVENLHMNEDGLYEAGTDFNIITTSIGAYVKNSPENYKEDWNRPSLASQHFCTNFIRNDMIGTAPIPHISYGFSSMDPDSLMLSGANDIYSSGASFISKAYNDEMYYGPDNQIDQTYKAKFKYNEMDFRRIQNGIKKQPDYLIVFRKDGIIPNLEETKKASKQWNNLPIVVVDIDLCLQKEYQKIQLMLQEFRQNQSVILANQIIQKILNNKITEPSFASDINLQEIKDFISQNTLTQEGPKLT